MLEEVCGIWREQAGKREHKKFSTTDAQQSSWPVSCPQLWQQEMMLREKTKDHPLTSFSNSFVRQSSVTTSYASKFQKFPSPLYRNSFSLFCFKPVLLAPVLQDLMSYSSTLSLSSILLILHMPVSYPSAQSQTKNSQLFQCPFLVSFSIHTVILIAFFFPFFASIMAFLETRRTRPALSAQNAGASRFFHSHSFPAL